MAVKVFTPPPFILRTKANLCTAENVLPLYQISLVLSFHHDFISLTYFKGRPGWLSLLLWLPRGSVLWIKGGRVIGYRPIPKMCSSCCPGNRFLFFPSPPSGMVKFIDYEYADYNYQAFDIGNHFNEFAGRCVLWWKEVQFASKSVSGPQHLREPNVEYWVEHIQ